MDFYGIKQWCHTLHLDLSSKSNEMCGSFLLRGKHFALNKIWRRSFWHWCAASKVDWIGKSLDTFRNRGTITFLNVGESVFNQPVELFILVKIDESKIQRRLLTGYIVHSASSQLKRVRTNQIQEVVVNDMFGLRSYSPAPWQKAILWSLLTQRW